MKVLGRLTLERGYRSKGFRRRYHKRTGKTLWGVYFFLDDFPDFKGGHTVDRAYVREIRAEMKKLDEWFAQQPGYSPRSKADLASPSQ